MGMYFKSYLERYFRILIAFILTCSLLLFSYLISYKKLHLLTGQLSSYENADCSHIYILNYGVGLENECLYPDMDIQIYVDPQGEQRLSVSSVMKEEDVTYDLEYLRKLSQLKPGEICVAENVAELYGIQKGDTLYARYSYSEKTVSIRVSAISETEFNYENPLIDNGVGIVFLGFNVQYGENTRSKYILFSDRSKVDKLHDYPQIIRDVIDRTAKEEAVFLQAYPYFVIEGIATAGAIILCNVCFLVGSKKLLIQCYMKGMQRSLMIVFPLFEKIAVCLLPGILVQFIAVCFLPHSHAAMIYMFIPIIVFLLYCVVSLVKDILRLKCRG